MYCEFKSIYLFIKQTNKETNKKQTNKQTNKKICHFLNRENENADGPATVLSGKWTATMASASLETDVDAVWCVPVSWETSAARGICVNRPRACTVTYPNTPGWESVGVRTNLCEPSKGPYCDMSQFSRVGIYRDKDWFCTFSSHA